MVSGRDASPDLDPAPDDWSALRQQAHRMLDDILDYQQHIRSRPVWQAAPDAVRARFQEGLPHAPGDLAALHARFMDEILPYAVGNAHPGFMGWVHGGGTPVGLLAEMLAAGLNANVGGRNQIPVEVERQLARWMAELFGFPDTASGLCLTGTSAANLHAVLVARTAARGPEVRAQGLAAQVLPPLTAYASAGAHGCIARALDIAGIGSDALRRIAMDSAGRMQVDALARAIAADRAAGCQPFMIIGTAGSVDIGAIDPLAQLADLAAREQLWLHIDGAFGALARLAPRLAPQLVGIERADSLAFDFHKWLQVPYDAGFLLVRDAARQRAAFEQPATYLARAEAGLAADSPWPCDLGMELSRGFRALKVWFTLQTYGAARLGEVIDTTCRLAQHLAGRVRATPELELLAPVALNIVCFRHRAVDEATAQRLNQAIVIAVQNSGIAAPSTTLIDGRLAIRAAIVNHRTRSQDVDALVDAVLRLGTTLQ